MNSGDPDVSANQTEENLAALDAIDDVCPALLDSFLGDSGTIDALFDALEPENADLEVLANAALQDFEGMGVSFLVMPGNLSGAFRQPAPVTPVGPLARPPRW